MNRYIHTMCMAFGADGEPDRVEVDATFDYLVAGSAVSDIRVLKIDGRDVNVADADLHDRIHDDLESGQFDDLLISLVTPSPQSVVVPVELAETPAIRNTLGLLRSAILCGEQWSDTCRDAYLAALKELDQLAMLAAAPALAGGEVLAAIDHLTTRLNKPGAFHMDDEPHLRAILAALSPEAPAEGAGERERLADAYIAGAMSVHEYWTENPGEAPRGDPEFDEAAGDYAYSILSDLRARSSAPEAREEALGNLLAVIHGDGGHRALEVGTKQAALEAEKIVAGLFADPDPEASAEGAGVAYGADHQPWCQPGDQTQRAFRLRFEDPDMREMVWTGPDAEKEALAAYNQYAPAWNVYLFSGHPRAAPSADKLRDHLEWIETVLTDPVPGYTARIATAREYIGQALAALSTPDALKGDAK